jgi:isopenicillin-N N-acyltransferase-like protein
MKEKKRIKVIECGGTPYEIGKQYGTASPESFTKSINRLAKEFSESQNASQQDINNVLKKYIPLVEKFDPELIEIMKGQADGAGVTFEEVFMLRCLFELGFYYQRMQTLCTSFAVTGRATKGGKTIIGQNFDASIGHPMDILRITHADGMKQLSLVFWGACELPLTSAGLGMVLNVIVSPVQVQRLVLPSCCVIPKAMRQQRIGDALGVFCAGGRSMLHICLASKEGDIISLETFPDDYNVLSPEKDILVHANHYHTEHFKKGELVYIGSPGSYIREPRLRHLIETHYGNITVESTMKFMSDHNNYPKSICNHPEDVPRPASTLSSIIMVPEDNVMYVTAGPPCENEYIEYKM